jgi:hypothetical protein
VRFPREWFGPPEELVPFGPSARAKDWERTEPTREDKPSSEQAATPPDFWGEGSAMLQDVIEMPRQSRREVAGGPGPSESEVVDSPPAVERAAAREIPRKRYRALIAAGAILASAAAAAAVLGIGASVRPSSHRTVLSVASVPSRSPAARQQAALRRARSTIRRPPKPPARHPTVARPVYRAPSVEAPPSTAGRSSASLSSTPVSSSTAVSSAQTAPRPSHDSSPAPSHSTASVQSGGAFTLGGP